MPPALNWRNTIRKTKNDHHTILGLTSIASLHLNGQHIVAVTTLGRIIRIQLYPHIKVIRHLVNPS